MAEPEGEKRLRRTSAAALAGCALAGLALGGLIPLLIERSGGIAPTVSWLSIGMLVLWAVALGYSAWTTHRTLHQRRQRIPPTRAVNLLVLGKASAVAGALVAGGYAGFVIVNLDSLDAALPRERVIRGSIAAVVSVVVMVGGLLLEWACRVPDEPDDEQTGTASAAG